MDLQVIGYWLFELSTYGWVIDPDAWLIILKVAFGLGMVIFVHELGHFGVAKLCGVQCDKFYLGFDIGGWKFCKFKWGETEYGIGILPLGGYVKMLGQEDNPARLKEELERAKAAKASGGETEKSAEDHKDNEPIDIEAAEQALYNPRSYLAQSVPKRMAIISAGVIMNIIFAFICAVIAYYMGVTQTACAVGPVQPGSPAWQAGLQTGDRIVAIDGKTTYIFNDLLAKVTLDGTTEGLALTVARPGNPEDIIITVCPTKADRLAKSIGVQCLLTTTFGNRGKKGEVLTCFPGSPAAEAKTPFLPGDRIVKINDISIENYFDLYRTLYQEADKNITVTVERRMVPEKGGPKDDKKKNREPVTELLAIDVSRCPMKRVGLVMSMGPVIAVQKDSPADKAGMLAGDVITKIDGQPVGDPMTISNRLHGHSERTVEVVVDRDGKDFTLTVKLRPMQSYGEPIRDRSAIGLSRMGIAFNVLSSVSSVIKGSPADRQGVKPGDVITEAILVLPDAETLKQQGLASLATQPQPLSLSDDKPNWAYLFYEGIQASPPGSKLTLTFTGNRTVTLDFYDSDDWFNPDRGFLLEVDTVLRKATSFGDAVSLGANETVESASRVFGFLQRLTSGDISVKALGGPVAIAETAGRAASQGTSSLFLFLTLLSANLAVINFLPIPVLDGGHMVFLAWEGIRGKPADERIQLLLSYIGLILILSLMIFVLALDFGFIPRK